MTLDHPADKTMGNSNANSGPRRRGGLLRRESFGGLLFVPKDAVHIELDHEAFAFMERHIRHEQQPSTDQERQLLEQIQQEVGPLHEVAQKGPWQLLDNDTPMAERPFACYSAPTLADFQITNHCTMDCPHCYAAASSDGNWVPLEKIERVVQQLVSNGVTQIALGGGEPLSHPHLRTILELCASGGLVPNLTSNGLYLNSANIAAIKQYCGAMALSLEGVGGNFSRSRKVGFDFFVERLELLLKSGVSTVLQVTLSQENFQELPDIVDFCLRYPALYGVIFLAYKQVGRGTGFHHTLAHLPPRVVHSQLRSAFLALSRQTRVGYDCCLTPGIVGLEDDLNFTQRDQLEGCSALRSSMGILPSLDVVPCTFTPQLVMGNLGRQSLSEIWGGQPAEDFRQRFITQMGSSKCSSCGSQLACLGGCPVFDLVHCQL